MSSKLIRLLRTLGLLSVSFGCFACFSAAQAAEGWRPILMSTAAVGTGQVQVFIVLEKSIPAPYTK